MHQSATGGPKTFQLTDCRNDHRRDHGATIRPVAYRIQGGILRKWLAPFAVGIALLSAFLTFMVLSGLTPIEPTRHVVYSFLLINAATILLLVGIIVREVWLVIQARRRGRAAARLHVQIVGLFSVIAVLPAVLVAIVANVTIDRGLDRLFSGPTREVIQNSLIIARAYTYEHAQLIRGDILGMANDIARARPLFDQDQRSFRELLTANCRLPQPAGRHADRQGSQHSVERADRHQAGIHDAAAGFPQQCQRKRAADRGLPRGQLCRSGDPAARVQRHLPLRRAAARSPRGRPAQADRGQRRRICPDRIPPARHPGRLRADVCGDRADHPDGVGADRAEFRQLAGGADPQPDERGQYRFDRRSARPGARPQIGRRSRAARRDLQQDDARNCAPSATNWSAPAT